MKIEKTESGYYKFKSDDLEFLLSPSDYLQLRDHFAKEIVPTDEESEKWFEENIGIVNDCSASSAVYKFREWLRERNNEDVWDQITGSKNGE